MIEVDRIGAVAILRMRNGENRFTSDFLTAFDASLDEIERDARALVTTGEEKFYSNGLDLIWLQEIDDSGPFFAALHALYERILTFPMVTVAAINGHAFAAGAMLAGAHDLAVMREDRGFWCLPEADIGIPFTPGMSALIQAKLSPGAANEAMVTGRRFGGIEAVERNIINEAVPEHRVVDRAVEVASQHVAKDPGTMRAIKTGMYGSVIERLRASAPAELPLHNGR